MPLLVSASLYLAALLIIRLKQGYEPSLLRITVISGIVPGSLGLLMIGMGEPRAFFIALPLSLAGAVVGFFSYTLVHILVVSIDWIDSRLESKPQ